MRTRKAKEENECLICRYNENHRSYKWIMVNGESQDVFTKELEDIIIKEYHSGMNIMAIAEKHGYNYDFIMALLEDTKQLPEIDKNCSNCFYLCKSTFNQSCKNWKYKGKEQ